jgi:hypothetical protein
VKDRNRRLVPSGDRDGVIKRTAEELGKVDRTENSSNLDHHIHQSKRRAAGSLRVFCDTASTDTPAAGRESVRLCGMP